jgi:hypothetical protein
MASEVVVAGKWTLDVEKLGGRYVVRLSNGYALSLGATKKCKDELIAKVSQGLMDDYINKHCNGGK